MRTDTTSLRSPHQQLAVLFLLVAHLSLSTLPSASALTLLRTPLSPVGVSGGAQIFGRRRVTTTTTTTSLCSSSSTDDKPSLFFAADATNRTESGEPSLAFCDSVSYVPLSERNASTTSGGFGESVPYAPPPSSSATAVAVTADLDEAEQLKANRFRNVAIAIASFVIAISNYANQILHPVTAVEILATMQSQSAPLAAVGNNGKPTVIDFWAPWCGNCKSAAPTLRAIEEEYADSVNFIMVNADEASSWPMIELFGVDSIPHMALLSGEGDVETALIGPIPRTALRADLDALLAKREGDGCGVSKAGASAALAADAPVSNVAVVSPTITLCHDELPYRMLDTFVKRDRRINFAGALEASEGR